MTAAVPLIHAFTVAALTGIMAKQTGESDGRNGEGLDGVVVWLSGTVEGIRQGRKLWN